MSHRYVTRLELGVAVVLVLISFFFIYQASFIRPVANDPIGPKVLPMFLSIAILLGGVFIALVALFGRKPAPTEGGGEIELPSGYGFKESNIGLIFAVIACGICYVITFWAFGYFVATFISVVLIMLTFGNRNWLLIIAISLLGAIVYQFIFMGLMGLFDPAGELLDVRKFTNWISGAQ